MSKMYKIPNFNCFHAVDLLIVSSNVIIFMMFVIVFFWFVVSRLMVEIILEKIDVVIELARRDPTLKEQILFYIQTNYGGLKEVAQRNYEERTKQNMDSLQSNVLPFVYTFILVTILLVGYIWKRRIHPTSQQYLLILLNILSFGTDLFMYYILVVRWIFVGDMNLIKIILSRQSSIPEG